jgi:high affinity Mn2+ porin
MRASNVAIIGAAFCALAACCRASADDTEPWSLHAQSTFIEQYHPALKSAFRGPNSLDPGSRGNETFDLTVFAGARLWDGGEAYADLEVDQGFGLSNTLGVAGFPSGEAYKVGKASPYLRLQRLFFRQTIDLGGPSEEIAGDANQLAGRRSANNLTLTIGKFSVTDLFDANALAHDPKKDFLNWAVIDSGAFDYAADAWGYSYGAAAEWTWAWWTLRAGLLDLSRVPNTTKLVRGFGQYELVEEFESRQQLFGRSGVLKLLAFANRGRMGSYSDALALAAETHALPDTALVRRPAWRAGVALNLEQDLSDDISAFIRLSANDGSEEAFEFTEINRSAALGVSWKGASWQRPDDTVALAFVINDLSHSARAYFAAGGLGILIGDGALVHYDNEKIIETYYNAEITDWLTAGADYQLILDPAYNADRGPVSVLGARLHAQM